MKNPIYLFAHAVLFCVATSASAEEINLDLHCTFSIECISGEECAETAYEVALNVAEVSESPAVTRVRGAFSSIAEEFDVTGFYKDGQISVSGGGVFPASHHFTVGADGMAIYTTHLGPEMGITYLGTCE